MIQNLEVKNLATIQHLSIGFGDGLNVITGETGAGKSIVLGALSLILGARASTDIIRTGFDECRVEALVDISTRSDIRKRLDDLGFDSGEELLVRRIINREGKNRIYINGSLCTLQMLVSITEGLVDLCGQRENHRLLVSAYQRDLFDAYCGLGDRLDKMSDVYKRLKSIRSELEASTSPDRENREDYLRYIVREIEELSPTADEEDGLIEEKNRLANMEKLIALSQQAGALLYEEDNSAHGALSSISGRIADISNPDRKLVEISETVKDLEHRLYDLYSEFQTYSSSLDQDPGRLDEIVSRLDEYASLKRKYGGSVQEILKSRDNALAELEKTGEFQVYIENLKKELEKLEGEAGLLAADIRKARLAGKKKFEKAVAGELADVALGSAALDVVIAEAGPLSEHGSEAVHFNFVPNPGEEPKPLSRIASGGELSRTMLALRNVFSDRSGVGVYLFDEVDSGIGGKTAIAVAKKLLKISSENQVICITHLPQIAAAGRSHFVVEKVVTSGRTKTSIRRIQENEVPSEISRMPGTDSKSTEKHAKELIRTVKEAEKRH